MRSWGLPAALALAASCSVPPPCQGEVVTELCSSTRGRPDASGGATYSVGASARRIRVWLEGADGGFVLDLRANESVMAGGHRYEFPGSDTLSGVNSEGFFGYVELAVDGRRGVLRFEYMGELASVDPPLDGGSGFGSRYVYETLLRRSLCVPSSTAGRDPRQLAGECNICGPGPTRRRYDVTRTGEVGLATYTFVAEQPPRGCGAGADLLEIEFPGG